MFSRIRHTLGEKSLKKKCSLVRRQKQVHNFESCKSAGIIFDATNPDDFSKVKEFMKELSQLKIKSDVIGYVNADAVHSNLLLWDNCHFFCNRDVDIMYRPKADISNSFLAKKFDILFDLTLTDVFTLRYLTTLSNSDFKVGRYYEGNNDLDLMIDISKEPAIMYLVSQIKVYLPMFKN